MQRILRLLRYARPYGLHLIASVVLMALVGLFDALRVLLIKPIFDRVLDPTIHTTPIKLFTLPGTDYTLDLQQLVPSRLHNDWVVVAFALVVGTVLKGIFDYLGTYLVNYAGFGM